LAFGIFLVLYGVLFSGGGHFMFFVRLALSPVWFGLVVWPLLGWLSISPTELEQKVSTALLVSHYALFIAMSLIFPEAIQSDLYWGGRPGVAGQISMVYIPWVLVYLAGQIYFWRRIAGSPAPDIRD
jgi:hypothetical protein